MSNISTDFKTQMLPGLPLQVNLPMINFLVMADRPSPMMPSFAGSPIVFLREVVAELSKVKWPTKEEVVKLTIIVIIVSAVLGLYIGALDLAFTKLTDLLIKR